MKSRTQRKLISKLTAASKIIEKSSRKSAADWSIFSPKLIKIIEKQQRIDNIKDKIKKVFNECL